MECISIQFSTQCPSFFIDKIREHGQTIVQYIATRYEEQYTKVSQLISSTITSLLESAQNNALLKFLDAKYKSIQSNGQLLLANATVLYTKSRATGEAFINKYFAPAAVHARTSYEKVQTIVGAVYECVQGKAIVERITAAIEVVRAYVAQLVQKISQVVDVPAVVERIQKAKDTVIQVKFEYYNAYVPPTIAKGTTIVQNTTTKAKQLYEPTVEKLSAARNVIEGKVLPLITSILDMFIAVQTRSNEVYKQSVAPFLTEDFVNSTKKSVADAVNNVTSKFVKVQAQ